jgi:hypothetical protein
MKTHNVTLTDAELLMVIEGLSAIASDYCTTDDEERPFNELKAKLKPLVTYRFTIPVKTADGGFDANVDATSAAEALYSARLDYPLPKYTLGEPRLAASIPVVDQEDDEFVLMERQWKGK